MVKTKFLIAGLLLAATSFGAEATWDFTGTNVEAKLTGYDSTTNTDVYGGKNEDLILKVTKKLDDKTSVSFKYDTDDSNPDYIIETVVNRKFNEFVEAQIDLDLITGDGTASKGLNLKEDYDSDKVYIKYTPNSKLAVKFNPYDISLRVGDFFVTDKEQKTPGIQAEYKLSDTASVYAGIGTGKWDDSANSTLSNFKNKAGENDTVYGVKAGFAYKNAATCLKGAFAMNTEDDENIFTGEATPLKMAGSLTASQKSGNLTLQGEALVTKVNKANSTISGNGVTESGNGLGLFGKAKYSIGTNTPYAKVVYASKYAFFKDKDYSALIGSSNVAKHGGLTALEVGNEFNLKGGLQVIPYVEMKTTENKIFTEKDGTTKTDKAIIGALKVKVTF